MTTFNTGNPLGSTDVYDRYDNSENLDNFSNGPLDAYADRLGVMRQSLQGIRNASQYQVLGPYAAGLVLTTNAQVFSYLGEFYAPSPSITLPYTTTGVGAPEIANFRSVGDAVLRSDLAINNNVAKGAALVGFGNTTVAGRLGQDVLLSDYAPLSGTDWTASFNTAIGVAASEGKVLRIPSGLDIQLGPVSLTASVVSDGAKITRLAATTGTWFTFGGHNLTFSGCELDGAGILAECFVASGTHGTTIEDNVISNVSDYVLLFNSADGLTVRKNKISNGYNGVSNYSVGASSSTNVRIYDNTFQTMAGSAVYLSGGTSPGDPLYFKTHMLVFDARVTGNNFTDISGHGVIGQAYGLVIANNTFKNCGNAPGIQSIVPQGYQVTVSGNTIDGGHGVGIDMGWCNVASVTGNTVRGAGQIGIELQSCFAVTCTGNAIEDCGSEETSTASSGIRIAQGFFGAGSVSFGVTVSGNTIRSGGAAGRFGISVGEDVKSLIVCGNHLILSASEATIFTGIGSSVLIYGNLQDAGKENTFTHISQGVGIAEMQSNTGNQDFYALPQGTGKLRFGYYADVASTPSGFSATHRIQVKDNDGNTLYVPAMFTKWG